MKTNFILNEGDKKRILELHKRATKNHYISKNILSEGKADSVKSYCNKCTSDVDRNKNRKYTKQKLYTVVDYFKDAYDDMVGTDMDSFNDGLNDMKNFTLNDFCAFLDLYKNQTGEDWYEATDSDIDYDSEWDMIIVSLRDIEDRQAKTNNTLSPQQQGGNFDNLFYLIYGLLKEKGWTFANSTQGDILYYGPWIIYKDIRKNPFPIVKFEDKKFTEKYKLKTIGTGTDDTILLDVYDNEVKMADLIKKFTPSVNNNSQVKNQVTYKKVPTQIKQPNYSLLNQ